MSQFKTGPDIGRAARKWRAALVPLGLLAAPAAGHADVIADVNTLLLNVIQNTSAALIDGSPNVAREIAMVDGAMFDAVNAASGNRYPSLAYAGGAVANAAPAVAALAAASSVMNSLYGSGSPYARYAGVTGVTYFGAASPYAGTMVGPTLAQYSAVTNDLNSIIAALGGLGSGTAVTAGIALGGAAGAAMIAARAGDGTNGPAGAMLGTLSYTAPPGAGTIAGIYIPPAARPTLEPGAGSVAPFVMTQAALDGLTRSVLGPPPLTSNAYAVQVLQTECQGAGIALPAAVAARCTAQGFAPETAAQATAALFWNDPGGTYQPPGHWLQIADGVALSQGLDLPTHAREAALVGAAMSSAGSAAWQVKYTTNLWRPVTAITDCNPWNAYVTTCDPAWRSLIATPPHPDHLAGHPAFSGAAATVLRNFFGTDNIPITSTSQAYCNAGTSLRDPAGDTVGCTLAAITYLVSNGNAAGGCNNATSQPVLNPDFTPNPLYNASPLICPITENFSGFSDASSGALGSTFSRVVGGIHTPGAVLDALMLGNAVGQAVASAAAIPAPGALAMVPAALALYGAARRRRLTSAGPVRLNM